MFDRWILMYYKSMNIFCDEVIKKFFSLDMEKGHLLKNNIFLYILYEVFLLRTFFLLVVLIENSIPNKNKLSLMKTTAN